MLRFTVRFHRFAQGWAETANFVHDNPALWEHYDYISSPPYDAPPPSGISQPDFNLAIQGMDLGELLASDSDFQESLALHHCDINQWPFNLYQMTDPANWIRTHLKQ